MKARLRSTYQPKSSSGVAEFLASPVNAHANVSRSANRFLEAALKNPEKVCGIAQAFQSINYPILPPIEAIETAVAQAGLASAGAQGTREIAHIRHYSLFAPRDFDISPYFAVVKPTIEAGFDYHSVKWESE